MIEMTVITHIQPTFLKAVFNFRITILFHAYHKNITHCKGLDLEVTNLFDFPTLLFNRY